LSSSKGLTLIGSPDRLVDMSLGKRYRQANRFSPTFEKVLDAMCQDS
jgi:hypothetical protein